MPAPPEFINFVDNNANAFIKRLGDAVAIPRYVLSYILMAGLDSGLNFVLLQHKWGCIVQKRCREDGPISRWPS